MTNLCIHTCKGEQQLQFENILRIEGMSNYSKIIFVDKSHPLIVSKTLAWVEQQLTTKIFLRTHRKHLVNKNFIAAIFLSGQYVELLNGEKISISRRRKIYVHEIIA
jgi:two-component system, LytTR family, response regulator